MLHRPLRKKRGNMILHGVTSGFGLSRMISSRLRRKYEHEYRKVHRSPRIIFVFDVTLGIAIIALFILVVSLIARPPEPPTLSMSFAAPSFVAGKATPMSVRLWPTDNREHSNVSVTWHIPRGWEILESDPPIRHNGMVILGTIPEGQDAVSRLIVRMFDSVGQNSVIGFTVRNLEDGTEKQYTGIGERRIVSSAITAEVPRVFDVDGVTPSGGVIPIEVRNTTDRTIPFVELRPTETSSIQFTRVTFGDLKPQESRFVYVPLGSLEESPNLEWALFATSREILRGSWSATLTSWDDPVITRPLIANPQADTFVRAEGGQGISLIMVQPFLEDAIREVQVEDEIADIKIPASNIDVTPQQQWFVAPVLRSASGDRLLGPATFGVFTGAFPFSAKAIYRTEAGDQLGLGPHPPRRGEETRYWIFWNMGPIQGKLRNVRVQTTIPKGVRLTGSIASPDGGSSTVSGQTIRWSMPEIGSDVGISEAFFGFEVSIIPGEEYEGESIQLGGITYASAVDDVSKMVLKAEKMALFSENIGVEDTAEVGGTE